MEIKVERPPNFEDIAKVFPIIRLQKGVLFAWDKVIYNPDNVPVTDPLRLHEECHADQQNGMPEGWWQHYLESPTFRFAQELEAHQVEYKAFYETCGVRNQRRAYLAACAKRLSGPLYGNCVSREKAIKLIKEVG